MVAHPPLILTNLDRFLLIHKVLIKHLVGFHSNSHNQLFKPKTVLHNYKGQLSGHNSSGQIKGSSLHKLKCNLYQILNNSKPLSLISIRECPKQQFQDKCINNPISQWVIFLNQIHFLQLKIYNNSLVI